MALSVNNEIIAGDIREIRVLKPSAVYLLVGENNDEVVVKRELTETSVIQSSKAVMKAIDPRAAKIKVLKPLELQALRHYIAEYERRAQNYQLEFGMALDEVQSRAIGDLEYRMDKVQEMGGNFLKMSRVDVA